MNPFRPQVLSWLLLVAVLSGCTVDSAQNHYLLAEKLWTDRKYSEAVSEFEKVISKDRRSKLGQQATYRAAMTQYLFLSQYNDAMRRFKGFIEISTDAQAIWDAQIQVGEILFSKTEQYDQAIVHYRKLLKDYPNAAEAPEFLFRIARSQFFLFHFDEAVNTYRELEKKFSNSKWAERAGFEVGATYFTRGEQSQAGPSTSLAAYEVAKEAYEKFVKKFPQSEKVPEARFGIASCLEELDKLEEASEAFATLKNTYPSPSVIEVKLNRIRQRIARRTSGH